MKPILLAAAAAVLALPALAQPLVPVPNDPATPLISCWYNPAGAYTGSDTAEAGVAPGGPVRTSPTGDYAWRYTIRAQNGTSCPRQMPG
jgi:hypothetical protein